MSKIAVDIVLLPSENMMNKVIAVNKELLKVFDNKIILNKENCLPHISLAMGGIRRKDLVSIQNNLHRVAEMFSPMNLKATDIYADTIPTGKKVSGFKIEKTKELQLLHESIMNDISPYFTYNITLDMVYPSPQVEEITLFWIKNYLKNSSFKNFFPHITIGFGEPNRINLPFNFTTSKLALCHLGNYCTCRKILLSAELKHF
ncbi:MAG: hypothetical protein QMD92_07740 [bacterium]|nr:hypothetical protein [bacterium]